MTSFLFHSLLPKGLIGQNTKMWPEAQLFRLGRHCEPQNERKVLPFYTLWTKFSLPLLLLLHANLPFHATIVICRLDLKKICRMGSSTKGLISKIYQILADLTPDTLPQHAFMAKWESYLGIHLKISGNV